MEETKKFRHTECGFNPLERMTVAVNDAGQILVDTLKSQGGSFLLNREDASVVYVPKLKLTLNDYKDWWNSAYPDGRIERSSEIHTVKATTWVQNGDVKTPLEYPYNEKTIEIKFFEHAEDAYPKAVGAGTVPYTYEDETADGLAEYMAWKSAMTSMGFGTDITAQDIYCALPMYCEKIEVESGVLSGSTETIPLRSISSDAVLIEPRTVETTVDEAEPSKSVPEKKRGRARKKDAEALSSDAARKPEKPECIQEEPSGAAFPVTPEKEDQKAQEEESPANTSPVMPVQITPQEEASSPEMSAPVKISQEIPDAERKTKAFEKSDAEDSKSESSFPEDTTEDFAELLRFAEGSGWTIEKARAQQITYVKEGGVKKIITRFVSGNTLGDVCDFSQGGINKGKELLNLMLRPSNRVYFDENTIRAAEFLVEAL